MPFRMTTKVLSTFDIYGHPIGVHHQGETLYKTRLGSLFTILTYVLIIINMVDLVTKF